MNDVPVVSRVLRALVGFQAAYYAITGIWPLVHIESFLLVTGDKYDVWLVETVGVLITAIGAALAIAAWRKRLSPEVIVLAVGSAVALGTIDTVYVIRERIPPIYLADAVIQAALILGWIWLAWSTRRSASKSRA